MTFSEEIKTVRLKLLLTQAEMASEMGVTEQTIRRWEHEGCNPRITSRRKLYALCAKHKIKLESEVNHDFYNR